MRFCAKVRRRAKARAMARACAAVLQRDPNAVLAGIILGERSAAWDALADGDVGMALEHLVELRWFMGHSADARRTAFAAMQEFSR